MATAFLIGKALILETFKKRFGTHILELKSYVKVSTLTSIVISGKTYPLSFFSLYKMVNALEATRKHCKGYV